MDCEVCEDVAYASDSHCKSLDDECDNFNFSQRIGNIPLTSKAIASNKPVGPVGVAVDRIPFGQSRMEGRTHEKSRIAERLCID